MYIKLDTNSKTHLYEQLYLQIKMKILEGRLNSHEKLPSKRQLKADLNISMTTIERAYQQLLDEDFIYSKEKSGFFVSHVEQLETRATSITYIKKPIHHKKALALGEINTSIIQSDIIRQIAKYVFSQSELFNPGEKSGDKDLKSVIKTYLHQNRGVNCVEDQIFIGPSTELLLEQLMLLMDYPALTIEDPGYPVIKDVCHRLNIPYDVAHLDAQGIDIHMVQKFNHEVTHVTPSHQFPSGTVMTLNRRIQLMNDATKNNRYIIEDDYDSEFRYEGNPLPSLQSLDQHDHTIYMCTFSKSIYPSLRLAVMVLPKPLAEKYYETGLSCNVPRQMQHIIMHFIKDGYLDKHINRMRKIYKEKMYDIVSWLKHTYPSVIVDGNHTGMHFTLKVPDKDLTSYIRRHQLISLNHYALHQNYKDTIVVGIGATETEEIKNILRKFLEDLSL